MALLQQKWMMKAADGLDFYPKPVFSMFKSSPCKDKAFQKAQSQGKEVWHFCSSVKQVRKQHYVGVGHSPHSSCFLDLWASVILAENLIIFNKSYLEDFKKSEWGKVLKVLILEHKKSQVICNIDFKSVHMSMCFSKGLLPKELSLSQQHHLWDMWMLRILVLVPDFLSQGWAGKIE